MAGIRSGGIKYALGKQTAIGTRAIDEGLALLEHTTPVPITDSMKGALTTRPDFGYDRDYHIPGTVYYITRIKIPFALAWVARILDLYFENTAIGVPTNYNRIYKPEDIPAEPSEWLSLWKYTAKTGVDHNVVGVGGVIYGITLEGSENEAVTLSADVAFATREIDVATGTPSDWTINESSGSYVPIRNSEFSFVAGAGLKNVISWRISLAHEFKPHFFTTQNPNRITRKGSPRINGQFTIRDTGSVLEEFEDALADSDNILFYLYHGTTGINTLTKIHGAETREEKGTRYGYYNFTGLSDEGGGTEEPLKIMISPGIAGL